MGLPRQPVRIAAAVNDLTTLDPILAHLLGWISYYSYYESALQFFQEGLSATDVLYIPADPTTGRPPGWVLTLDECNVVSFAGIPDYSYLYGQLRDTYYRRVLGFATSVCGGNTWTAHARDVWNGFKDAIYPRMQAKVTLFTGHSLGAGIAALLHASLIAQKGDRSLQPSNAVVFGCPRLGNANLAAATSGQFNVINEGDIVSKLPHAGYVRPVFGGSGDEFGVTPFSPFKGHGKRTYLQPNGHFYSLDAGEGAFSDDVGVEWDATRVFGKTFFSGASFTNPVTNTRDIFGKGVEVHYMQEYLSRLEKNLPPIPRDEGVSSFKGAVEIADALPPAPPVLSTIEMTPSPAPIPTPKASPLRGRTRH